MHRAKRIAIAQLSQQLTCKLCKGYFIDATTIIECLHTFCRSCIVQYLGKNKYCPVCDVQVHKTKPLLNIRPDKTIQDIVYKLVPRLFQNEMQRRREFYDNHTEAKPTNAELYNDGSYLHLLTPEETVCLTLNYHGCNAMPRYLRCPAAVSVVHLKKLIQAKYDLTDNHRVEILYNQDCLNSTLTLMDVAYMYLWKRKSPIELSYRIYECTSKKLKLDPENVETSQNNNNWKEVQLRISENGEMSITGIQDELLDLVDKYKSDVTLADTKTMKTNTITTTATKKELPGLKYIGKSPPICVTSRPLICITSSSQSATTSTHCTVSSQQNVLACVTDPKNTLTLVKLPVDSGFSTGGASLSSATTTTVFSTINTSKCSTKTDDEKVRSEALIEKRDDLISAQTDRLVACNDIKPPILVAETKNVTLLDRPISAVSNSVVTLEKGVKRKNETTPETGLPLKVPKQTILNHSIGLLNLSNNHPLKKHSKLNRNGENPDGVKVAAVSTKGAYFNKNFQQNGPINRPGTPITIPIPQVGNSQPCYMPKTSYSPIINVPKPTTSTCGSTKMDPPQITKPLLLKNEAQSPPSTSRIDTKTSASITPPTNKLNIKSKASTPIGYKTLRDPPKSWNSQISKANLNNKPPDPKYSDLKNVRPAKFFKMRNNMPRYLGNPASGVKPMYQLHVSPEKDKDSGKATVVEKSEIKKHSIVKIDPKTLKPISEKAPETTSLSNQSDLKINTSSVSIFNPLKLQSSPKNERRSPKSPHSPKLKSSSPTNKRDKVNLNFTPPNPFIPNLTTPTLSPNQFLYPQAPGFPSYDPRVMAAYHTLWYGQRMAFPPPMAGISLDLNQRKQFEIVAPPTSPKIASHSPQILTKLVANSASAARTSNSSPSISKTSSACKKQVKEANKNEKSLENAVEKLTQNRAKEIVKNEVVSAKTAASAPKNKKVEEKPLMDSKEENKSSAEEKNNVDSRVNSSSLVQSSPLAESSVKKDEVRTSDKLKDVLSKSKVGSEPTTDSSIKSASSSEVEESAGTKSANKNVSNNNTNNSADLAEVAGAK